MSILANLSKPPIKAAPDVWIQRIVLLEKITPEPVVIRDIPLRRGLNVVWAEEPESTEDTGDIAGHSAGKTTFCRLMRYVLGESTFSNKANMQAIKKSFPAGYVAAELYVKGQLYAVLRPLGENRNSYVLKDGSVESVIIDRGEVAYQETYPAKLGLDTFVEDFATSSIVRTNQPIEWGHLLAWSARDQEARFQNIHDWRSPRSESNWPTFRFPKSDPLFVMRVALGLFLDDELRSEQTLAESLRDLTNKETNLERAKREPEYWRDHEDQKLRAKLSAILPSDKTEIAEAKLKTDDVLFDLHRFTSKAALEIGLKRDAAENRIKNIEKDIAPLRDELSQLKRSQAQLRALFQVDERASQELASAKSQQESEKERIQRAQDDLCPFGNVLIRNCTHVKDRQALLSRPDKDAKLTQEELAAREAEKKKVAAELAQLESNIEKTQATITAKVNQQQTERKLIDAQDREAEALTATLESLVIWTERAATPDKFEKLTLLSKEIEILRNQIEQKQQALNKLLAEHDETRDLLSRIFSACAKQVLPSSAYDGAVRFEDRELNFQITKRGTMTGEAMETLAVLLGDISCLIFNSLSGKSRLPGFMIHDSPREADLGLRLYHSFIRFVATLDHAFTERGGCPFQYILTTTTPPPKQILESQAIRLQLDASTQSGLLFKTDLSDATEASNLLLR